MWKVGILFDIQLKGVTPISTMFRAATGTVTLGVVVVWVGPTILLHILQKIHAVTGTPAIKGSFWTATDHEPGLSCKYGYVPLILGYIKVFFLSPARILLTESHQFAVADDATSLFDHLISKYLTSVHVCLAADTLAWLPGSFVAAKWSQRSQRDRHTCTHRLCPVCIKSAV